MPQSVPSVSLNSTTCPIFIFMAFLDVANAQDRAANYGSTAVAAVSTATSWVSESKVAEVEFTAASALVCTKVW